MNDYYKNFDFAEAEKLIKQALKEDIGKGDITSETLIPKDKITQARLLLKESSLVSGLKIFEMVFKIIDKNIKFTGKVKEGKFYGKGTVLCQLKGNTISLLKGERTALNILQRMSGISNNVYKIVKMIGKKPGLLDTRKTTPNFRIFEKLAVKIGGGINHRKGLFDMMLIKDNHIEACGNIIGVIEVLNKNKNKLLNIKKEIEVKNLDEVLIVEKHGKELFDIVMLDNFSLGNLKNAIELLKGRFKIEASGGINLSNIKNYAKIKGLDYISSGSLTHSVKSTDISFDFFT